MRQRVTRGLGWTGASQVALQIIRTGGAIVVARLLTPDEYGLAMLALVFASLVLVFSDLALGAALVQRKSLTEPTAAPRSGSPWAAACCSRSSASRSPAPSRTSTASPTPQPLLAVLSLSFILTALGATQQSLLLREMDFRQARDADGRRRAGRQLSRPSCWPRLGDRRRGRSSASSSRPPPSRAPLCGAHRRWRPQLLFSRASLRDLWRLQRATCGPSPPLLPAPERRPLPHRALHWHGGPRRLRGRLQRDARAGGADRRPAPARARPRLLAHAGRAGADRRGLGARDAAGRRDRRSRRSPAW